MSVKVSKIIVSCCLETIEHTVKYNKKNGYYFGEVYDDYDGSIVQDFNGYYKNDKMYGKHSFREDNHKPTISYYDENGTTLKMNKFYLTYNEELKRMKMTKI